MARKTEMKKAVIFIVEGKSDKTALEHIFKVIYKHKNVTFEFTKGDVTSDETLTLDEIKSIIYEKVEAYMKENKLNKNHIWQIIQIFDTDGTYIPENAIIMGETGKLYYSTKVISCNDREKVIRRNKWKSKTMDELLNLSEIKGIPYRCYFMSSNLDHALYNKMNLSDEEKELYSNKFYEMFDGHEKLFINFLESDAVNGCPDSFPASWKYIREELHSLERHTNLHIYFKENPYL
ncbi:MAG: hypothetical protein Q4F28_02070 [Eubacteriales bacterium]|nr:hypothetical protein [Eubacteriales bacterium]